MTFAAVAAGFNDLEYSIIGYFWMILNCFCTSGYVLYMRYASSNIKLPKFGMVYYNNLLSLGLLIPFCLLRGEEKVFFDREIMTNNFIIINCVAGFLGFYLNFASLWCVGVTSATTYAIIGSLNKVPITVLGFVLFDAKMTDSGIMYVGLATLAGFVYAYSKLPASK